MSRHRLFLAFELTPGVRKRVIALQQDLTDLAAGVKWVEPENIHLTLLFLGEVGDRDLLAVCRAAQAAAADIPAFSFELAGVGAFPNTRRPRILWAGVGAGKEEVCAVHDALEPPLLDLGCYRREERQYTPHITLGRLKVDRPDTQLGVALQKYQTWHGGECPVSEVVVMSSQLAPSGPTYTPMGRAKLA